MAKVTTIITIKAEGEMGSGKTRTIEKLIRQIVVDFGGVRKIERDEDGHSVKIVLETTLNDTHEVEPA